MEDIFLSTKPAEKQVLVYVLLVITVENLPIRESAAAR